MNENEFDSALKFLEALDPAKTASNLYFRGQPDVDFELVPSVWRYGKDNRLDALFTSFCNKMIHKVPSIKDTLEKIAKEELKKIGRKIEDCPIEQMVKWVMYVKFENYLLCSFYNLANNTGLKVPSLFLQRVGAGLEDKNYWFSEEFGRCHINNSFFAGFFKYFFNQEFGRYTVLFYPDPSLPQHAGLPTRLLDWTTNPRKAACFAAFKALSLKSEKMAVYAIKTNNVDQRNSPIHIINNHYRYENQFLYAQDGLFTQTYGDFYYIKNGVWPSIEDLIQEHNGGHCDLEKFVLPSNHARELLERLSNCGISISTLMPGYSGIAEQIKLFEYD